MCRHAAYVGPGIAATELLRDLDHSLYHQSYQARELLTGVVCADGYGFGWYDEDIEAGRYASGSPIWADPNLHTTANHVRSHMLIAAVRNGTLPSGNQAADAAPYQAGRYLWSLNGFVTGFSEHWRDGPLRDWIHADRRDVIKAVAAVAAIAAPARLRAQGVFRLALTPVFLDNDAEIIAQLRAALSEGMDGPIELVQRRTYQEITGALMDGSVDAAFMVGVLEHVLDQAAACRALARVLRPGGVFACLTHDGGSLWHRLAPRLGLEDRHLATDRYLDRPRATALLRRSGFVDIRLRPWAFHPRGDMPPRLGTLLGWLEGLGGVPGLTLLAGGLAWRAVRPGGGP